MITYKYINIERQEAKYLAKIKKKKMKRKKSLQS